ncbi:hypothetical protein BpHYR1_018649 [Brachionus plicatilis]|uniref:Uncharacterized protein n=1 Tax=Brachionus plicatilis TaxID=10195 RepID=A0A3M7PV60_BRAPC|nr:hypothetical protein BpHYR1_018649 [Brachionus plicatilis]
MLLLLHQSWVYLKADFSQFALNKINPVLISKTASKFCSHLIEPFFMTSALAVLAKNKENK